MKHHPSWIRYRQVLAEEFGLRLNEPIERTLSLRGHVLRLDEWRPDGDPRGTLILVHGGGGNGRVLAPFAEQAIACGWRVLAPDLPGYGLTRPSAAFDWDYAEWPAVIADLADREDGPVALMGLSMGGMTAVAASQSSRKVAAVIATTLLDLSDRTAFVAAARWPWLGQLTLFGLSVMPGLLDRIPVPLWLAAPLRAMSSNPRLQNYFSRDSLLGTSWKPMRFF